MVKKQKNRTGQHLIRYFVANPLYRDTRSEVQTQNATLLMPDQQKAH